MREIKFRAWYPSVKKMVYFENPFVGYDCNEKWAMMLYPKGGVVYLEACELTQYTGLKDKHGKPLYEGDIVKEGGIISIIEWAKDNARFCYKTETGVVGLYGFYGEIIGNVFENHELSKEVKND